MDYTITLSAEEWAGVEWAAANLNPPMPGVEPPTAQEFMDSQVHNMVRPWMLRNQAAQAPAPAASVAEAYLAAPPETQQEVVTLLGVEPAPTPPAMMYTPV